MTNKTDRGMTRYRDLPAFLLMIGLVLVWIALVVALVRHPQEAQPGLRLFMYALCGAMTILSLGQRYRSFLISPLFLLGLLSTLFYSFVTWLWNYSQIDMFHRMIAINRISAENFIGGKGELIVFQFSALSLLAALVLAHFGQDRRPSKSRVAREFSSTSLPKLARLTVGVFLFSVGILAGRNLSPEAAAWMADGTGKQLLHATAPLISLTGILLLAIAKGRSTGWGIFAISGLLVGCAALLLTFAAKTSVYLALAGLAYFVVHSRVSSRGIVLVSAAASLIVVVLLIVTSVIRNSDISSGYSGGVVYMVIEAKLLLRQIETAGCFQSAIEQSLPAGKNESPFYFTSVIVPRLFWQDKPNFSLGSEYATLYCGFRPNSQNSASITLLGQPIVRAGWAGLAVAQSTLIIGLVGITWLAGRTRPIGPIVIAALLPWLIDFDQSFALYVGNAVKHFLWMLPIGAAIYWFAGSTAPAKETSP